jgi:dihydroorotate dehydrogenase
MRDYNLITYKTVRGYEYEGNLNQGIGKVLGYYDSVAIVKYGYYGYSDSLVNSMGIPSTSPDMWMTEVEEILIKKPKEAELIVSIFGETNAEVVALAKLVRSLGNDIIIEINASCPNTPEGLWLTAHEPSPYSPLLEQLRSHVDGPVGVKLGFVDNYRNMLFSLTSYGIADFITMCNTKSVLVLDENGVPFYERTHAGISGFAIRREALSQIREFVSLRDRYRPNTAIIGVGGLTVYDKVLMFNQIGVDAYQMATFVMSKTRVRHE